jgi:hypothetical protein
LISVKSDTNLTASLDQNQGGPTQLMRETARSTGTSAMKKPTAHLQPEPQDVPAGERRVQGKVLRKAVPRQARGRWKVARDRQNIVDLLNESNEGCLPQLGPIRFGHTSRLPWKSDQQPLA